MHRPARKSPIHKVTTDAESNSRDKMLRMVKALNLFVKLIAEVLAKCIAIATCGCAALILIVHLSLGHKSPGIIAIAETSIRYWIPLIFLLCILFAAIGATRAFWSANRIPAAAGLSLWQYLDLPPKDREVLRERFLEDEISS